MPKIMKSCLNLSKLRPKYCGSFFSGHGVEHNLLVCIRTSEAEVTDKEILHSKYCTDRHEASRGLSVTTELLVVSEDPPPPVEPPRS